MIQKEVYEKLVKKDETILWNKKGILKFIIALFITFLILTLFCITQGLLKIREYEEYALNIENANITTVIGPLIFTGPFYVFCISLIISFVSRFFKQIDTQTKKILKYVPLYVIILIIPTWVILMYSYESICLH
jgi:magnesium-transporting ATPase (P-type)